MHEHIQTVILQMFLNFAHYKSAQQGVDTLQLERKTQPLACISFLTLWDHVKLALLLIKGHLHIEKQALCRTGSDSCFCGSSNCVHTCLFLSLDFPNNPC